MILQIDKTGCGKTKGCYSLPSNCAGSSDCTYLFTYQVSGESVTMEMSAKQRWASVAFNEQKKMVRVWYNCILLTSCGPNCSTPYSSSRPKEHLITRVNREAMMMVVDWEKGHIGSCCSMFIAVNEQCGCI